MKRDAGGNPLKLGGAVAVAVVTALAFALFYGLNLLREDGASSFGLANIAGLLTVLVGLFAAGLIFRRGKPVT